MSDYTSMVQAGADDAGDFAPPATSQDTPAPALRDKPAGLPAEGSLAKSYSQVVLANANLQSELAVLKTNIEVLRHENAEARKLSPEWLADVGSTAEPQPDLLTQMLDCGWTVRLFKNQLGSYTAWGKSLDGRKIDTDDFTPEQAMTRLAYKIHGKILDARGGKHEAEKR